MSLRDRRDLTRIENQLRNNKAKRQRVLDAINEVRKRKGQPAIKADVNDWKSFWETIKPYVMASLKMLLALLLM